MAERHVLYQYASCPFCHRVRQFLEWEGIAMEMRDTLRDGQARRELIEGGGRATVPCLRIERDGQVRWLYESSDIIGYLRSHLARTGSGAANPDDAPSELSSIDHRTGSNP